MLLGKRSRPAFRRTTSMTGISVDLSDVEAQEAYDQPNKDMHATMGPEGPIVVTQKMMMNYSALVSPRHHKSGCDVIGTSHFLLTCGFCNCRLAPARDIYMYKGDTAFCSLECREQQIKQDERRERCTTNDHRHAPPSTAASRGSKKNQNVAAN